MFMKCALVLAGGGAKGAYQIGVWKALRKLSIPIDIVTGSSVGALNGAMVVQGDYFRAKRLWKKMSFQVVFDKNVIKQYNHCKTTKDMLRMFSLNFFLRGGMDIRKLENVVNQYLHPKKFFRSKIDYGISVYDFSDLKPIKLVKNDLKKNTVDYIVASSCCFPAFQMKKIGDKKYIDGGFSDYIPINLALDMGADEIIAVDLHAPGIREKIRKTTVPITYIEPNNDIGGFLNFNQANAKRAMRYGYLDAMKVYHQLDGRRFTFKKNTLYTCLERYNTPLIDTLNFVFDFEENKTTLEELLTLAAYKRMVSMKKNQTQTIFLDILENLALTFGFQEGKIYSLRKFHKLLFRRLEQAPMINSENIRNSIKNKKISTYLNKRSIIRYFYKQIGRCYQDSSYKKPLCKLALIFPKEFLSALYLHSVSKKGFFLW